MIVEALYALLDGAVECEVHPWPGPDNNYPLVTYQRDYESAGSNFDGATGLHKSEFDVSCWSESYIESQQLADQIRAALTDFGGAVSGVNLQRVHLANQIDQFDTEVGLHRAMLQIHIAYSEE